MVAKRKNVGGRPRQGEQVKRAPLNLRTDPRLRAKIEDATDAHGWSLTQEVETRLNTSFTLEQVTGGPHITAFTTMLAATIARIESQTRRRWTADGATWAAAEAAALRLLRWDRPPARQEDLDLSEAAGRADEASAAWQAARKALDDYRASLGILSIHGVAIDLPARAVPAGLFGGAAPVRWVDDREGWSDDQRLEESRLEAIERAAADRAAEANAALGLILEPAARHWREAKETGTSVAEAFLSMIGPRPGAKAEMADRDC